MKVKEINKPGNAPDRHIENEAEFWVFMAANGPSGKNSKTNYISWLRFVAKEYSPINSMLSSHRVNELCARILADSDNREIYKKPKDTTNIKSALNKYCKFIKANTKFNLYEEIDTVVKDHNLDQTTKKAIIDARIGQGLFRENLIAIWKSCSIGKYEKIDLLIASHIKPWKDSTNREKLDPYNGLLLKPNYDKLFDKGYISFEDSGIIKISPLLLEADLLAFGVSRADKLCKVEKRHKFYLAYHRGNCFLL